jgi:hypothetical protein
LLTGTAVPIPPSAAKILLDRLVGAHTERSP